MKNAPIFAVAILTLFSWVSAHGEEGIVNIPGGTFVMGTERESIADLKSRFSVDWDGVFENETPAHRVRLGDFRIDRHEVTNQAFHEFLLARPEWGKAHVHAGSHNGDYLAHWTDDRYPAGKAQHPVVFVTWAAAQSYCRWRGGRLPTEAEWEYVARSGDEREFPWGDKLPQPDLANYYANGIDETVAVGSYPPNEWGVYDLAGNVWEFLLDRWTATYTVDAQVDPIEGGEVTDESIAAVEGRRAVRGASYAGSVVNLRTRWRDSHVVSNAIGFVGFRCAYGSNDR